MAAHQRIAGAHDLHFAQVAVIGAAAGTDAGHTLAGFGQQTFELAVLAGHRLAAAGDDELVGLAVGDRAIDLVNQHALDDALALDQREHLGLGRGLATLGRDEGEAGAEAVERDHDLQARIHAVRDLDRRHRLAGVVARDELLDRLGTDLQVGVVGGGQAVAQPQRVDARKLRVGRQADAQRPAGLVEEQPQVRSGGQVVFHAFSPLA